MTEDEMVGCHHRLDGHESEQAPGVGDDREAWCAAFVSKVISLFFNTLFRFVIAFLPRSKHLLNSWLESPSTVDLGAQGNKICHCFYFPPSIYCEVMGPDAMTLVF